MSATVLYFDPRGLQQPRRLTLDDAIASAMVRSGVAAAVDPAQAGALMAGGPLASGDLVEVALQHGAAGGRVARILLPAAVATIAAASGQAAGVAGPIAAGGGTPVISGTLPKATAGQPYDASLTVTPAGTAVTLRPADVTALNARGITHNGFGRFTSAQVTA